MSSQKRFKDRVCVITASSSGIGFAIARQFAAEGGKVVISSRRKEAVDKAVEELSTTVPGATIIGIPCHVASAAQRVALLEKVKKDLGPIDVLVLNAAVSTHYGATLSTSTAAYDKMFEVNVRSAFLFVQEAISHHALAPSTFVPNGFTTNVLLVSSFAGLNPTPPTGIYGVTKTAMLALVKSLMPELAQSGIRINAIAPGIVRTKFAQTLVSDAEQRQAKNERSAIGAMGRVGRPSEIGSVAGFICGPDASYITGETIIAAGGVESRL